MPSSDRQQRLAALRDSIADIERKPALAQARVQVENKTGAFPKFGHGLLQEVFTDEPRNSGAVLGFALAQARGLINAQRPALIYLQLASEGQKLGLPYGPGLLSFGLDPDRLVLVRVPSMAEMLWAAEEALACRAVAAIIADIGSHSKLLDFTASRRLSMRSAATGGSIFMLRYGLERQTSAAHLRWRLSPVLSVSSQYDSKAPGPPRWRAELERGTLIKHQASWLLGWTDDGFATFELERPIDNGHRGGTAVPRAVSAQLADRLSQTA
jgi:protein ImuA